MGLLGQSDTGNAVWKAGCMGMVNAASLHDIKEAGTAGFTEFIAFLFGYATPRKTGDPRDVIYAMQGLLDHTQLPDDAAALCTGLQLVSKGCVHACYYCGTEDAGGIKGRQFLRDLGTCAKK